MRALTRFLATFAVVAVITVQGAQTRNPSAAQVYSSGENSVHRISEHVGRITKAVKRFGTTTVNLQGTALLPSAHGEARVQNKQSGVAIAAGFDGLVGAMRFGPVEAVEAKYELLRAGIIPQTFCRRG